MAPQSKPDLSLVGQLPGIKEQAKEQDDLRFQEGWDKDNPYPESFEHAMDFLRSDDREDWKEAGIKIKTTSVWTGMGDKIRCVIKCETTDAEPAKYEQNITLDPPNPSMHKAKIIELAQEAHTFLRKHVMAERL